jgi:molybdopterin converting factor small subunit
MNAHLTISYLGLVRNVLGCDRERIELARGTTVRDLLQILIGKHGDRFRMSVFKSEGKLRSSTLICVNDQDIEELEGFETTLESGENVSVIVGVYPPEGG